MFKERLYAIPLMNGKWNKKKGIETNPHLVNHPAAVVPSFEKKEPNKTNKQNNWRKKSTKILD